MKPRRDLHPFPLSEVKEALAGKRPLQMMTMSEGQWDGLLSTAYETGWVLVELDENEQLLRAYRKNDEGTASYGHRDSKTMYRD